MKQNETYLTYYSVGTALDGLFQTVGLKERIFQLMLSNSNHIKAIKLKKKNGKRSI